MPSGGRALVLGGGGVTGIAWETGLLAGLVEAGIDLTAADVVVGTSAGSVVGAQILSGVSANDLYTEQLAEPKAEIAANWARPLCCVSPQPCSGPEAKSAGGRDSAAPH